MAPAIADAVRVRQAQATASSQDTSPGDHSIPSSNGLGPSTSTPGSTTAEDTTTTNTTTVLIVVIILCGSAIMSAALFYIFDRKKNRQFREACKRDPYLTRKEFTRRRKLSALERLEEEELQRSIMIRKSLASKTPSRSTSRGSSSEEDEESFDLGTLRRHAALARMMPEPPCEHRDILQQQHQQQQQYHNQHEQAMMGGEWAPSEARRARSDSESSSSCVSSADSSRRQRATATALNTAKLHSPLFVQLTNDLLWTQAHTVKDPSGNHKAVVNKRQELRRRRKELRRRRKVFDENNNIYTPKKYKPKMLPSDNENAEGFRDDLNMVVMCPDCKEYPPNLVEEFSSGDMVCGSCGLVVGERIIDTRSEWRTFANDDQGNDDPSRVGDAVNPLLNGSQLETTIAFGEGRDSKQLARLQNKSQNDKASKSLMQAYKEIGAFCDSINLGKNVSDAAKHIFKLTYDHNFMKGKPQEAVIAGCIFIACRQTGVGRTFREIFQVTHVSKKEIGRVFKQLESFLQKIKEENPRGAGSLSNLDGYKASASTSAEDLCTRFCSNLNFRNAQKIENVSRALARKTSSVSELAGRSPLSVAAACIYMAAHLMAEPKTSKAIAGVAGVSDGTIKTAYRFLFNAKGKLVEKEWGYDKKAFDTLPSNYFPVFNPQLTSLHRLTDSVNDQDEQPFDWSPVACSFKGCATTREGGTLPSDMAVLAGPYCTQILGDLGAEVIKIEHPTRGDDTRAWGPPYATYKADSGKQGPGESAYFLAVNRNKKSLGLNFQHPDGIAILHQLVAKCDILVENYLPGTLAKYQLDYATLRAINPGLIYASITGYGQTGPYSDRAGYDVMVEAEFGLMHITGSRGGEPVKVGVAVTDLTTGLYTSNSIMAALLARGRTGRGQHIDVALSDCQTATLANIASSCLVSGEKDSGRWGTAHPSIVPYKSFKTKDGDILFGGGNDRLYGILCAGLGRPEWADDAKYKTNAQRVANRVELEGKIEAVTVTKTTAEWLAVFEGRGMPYAAVNDVQGTLEHAHTKARNMVVEMEHGACGPVRMVNTPVKYSESEPGVRTAPPTLGQHTSEVLGEHLGLSEERIGELKGGGVIGSRQG
ncbi:Succinate--hydroxymethylglutarate CoA-transferase [Colletotrichum gloeosporioides]|uniref:Transcription initiation factor IIB n=1 Tax=Colletotrichum gloeosporioides TaxID=474922 RepID=A0A8H4C510_COLGL|nr:Succinate--hydroxymethylglutarate CoA-transferase [Colletotrichum gloeosporioides]KAF3797455.1 Succinate--hydroxymethylglutarate CoA-transferase [Colletotrichum gloeosporioides]